MQALCDLSATMLITIWQLPCINKLKILKRIYLNPKPQALPEQSQLHQTMSQIPIQTMDGQSLFRVPSDLINWGSVGRDKKLAWFTTHVARTIGKGVSLRSVGRVAQAMIDIFCQSLGRAENKLPQGEHRELFKPSDVIVI